jgi:hypothetical protein
MANITLPSPNVPIAKAKCVHCGKDYEVVIDKIWFQKLLEILKLINTSL